MFKKISLSLVALIIAFAICGCSSSVQPESSEEAVESATASKSFDESTVAPEITPPALIVPEHEIELVAKTLRGECYDDQPDDKREVVKVICNRVSDSGFGDSIEAVITAPRQFHGYRPKNEPTANDYEIAREVLTEWYESGCQPLGEYLFFSSGGGKTNIFRKEWKEE